MNFLIFADEEGIEFLKRTWLYFATSFLSVNVRNSGEQWGKSAVRYAQACVEELYCFKGGQKMMGL